MWRPHCWQYANPIGVAVPHRGHSAVFAGDDGRATGGGGSAAGVIIGGAAIGGPIIGAPPIGGGALGAAAASPLPQLRQNFMPGGFSPRHVPQITGNPGDDGGVCPYAGGGADSALPQFRQNDDPAGLSWPQIEQRISVPEAVSQPARRAGMVSGWFTRLAAAC
jgi:hypothetical protein